MDIMRQSACLVVNPIMVDSYGFKVDPRCTSVSDSTEFRGIGRGSSDWVKAFSLKIKITGYGVFHSIEASNHCSCS